MEYVYAVGEGYIYVYHDPEVAETLGGITYYTSVTSYLGNEVDGEILSNGETLLVFAGGSAVETTINSGGWQQVRASTATSTTINSGGLQSLQESAATDTTINSGGSQDLFEANAIDTTIKSGGEQGVGYDGLAIGTTINSGGIQILGAALGQDGEYFLSGGTASGTTINSGALLIDENLSDSSIDNVFIKNGGKIDLQDFAYDPNANDYIGPSAVYKIGSETFDSNATLVISEYGSSYSIGLSSQSINENFILSDDGSGGTLITAGSGNLTIDPADKAETDSTSLTLGTDGSITASPVMGTIGFTDADPSATPSASVEPDPIVTASGPDGSIALTADQQTALTNAFQISDVSTDGASGDGTVGWTYSPDAKALSFLTTGKTAEIQFTVDVSDSDGNSDRSYCKVCCKMGR